MSPLPSAEKSREPPLDGFENFQDKDSLHNDRSYLNTEDLARDDSRAGSSGLTRVPMG